MMKNNTERFIEKAMNTLNDIEEPSAERKDAILQRVLLQGETESAAARFKNFVAVYPWRFALGVSVVQSVACTLIFGSSYTNLIMQLMGR